MTIPNDMKENNPNTTLKKAYDVPAMTILHIAPMQLLADSDPNVYTTNEKADAEYGALVKENEDGGFWNDDWRE